MKRNRIFALAAAVALMLAVGFLVPSVARAQRPAGAPPFDREVSTTPLSLNPYLEILRDPTGQLTIDQVAAPSFTGFAPNGPTTPNFGFTGDAVWARFTMQNASDHARDYYVQLAAPGVRFVDFYTPGSEPGVFSAAYAGWDRTTEPRRVPSASSVFPLKIPAQSETTYYVRVASDVGPVQLPLTLTGEEAFEASNRTLDTLNGALIGGLLLMATYGLVMFVRLRERNYLRLAAFSAVFGVFYFSTSDIAAVWFGSSRLAIFWQQLPLLTAATLVTYLVFCDAFLELSTRLRWAHRITRGMMALCAITLVFVPLGLSRLASMIEVVIGLFITVAVPVFALWVWRLGYKPAGYFFVVMLLPLIANALVNVGRLGGIAWEPWYALIGPSSALALIFISALVMADRINEMGRDATRNARRLGEYLDAIPVGVAVYDATQQAIYINAAAEDLTGTRSRPQPRSTYVEATEMFPAYVAGAETLYPYGKLPLIQALAGQSASADDMEIEVHGQRIALEAWARPLRDESDAVEAVVTTFLDITERRHREAELEAYRYHLEELVDERTEAERHEREIAEALQHTATALASSLNMEGVVEIVLQQLSRVTAYKGALVALLDNHDLIVVGANGLCAPALRHREPMAAQASAAEVLRAARERLCDQFLPPTNGATTQPGVLDVPLVNQGQTLGVLVVVTDATEGAVADNDNVIQAFADQAALAVANARLYRQARLAAAAEEREMLARELHDAVTQTLCSANLLAGTALGLWADAPPAARRPIEDVQWLLNGAVAEMRTLLLELRPWALAASPLEAILPPLFDAFTGRTHVPVDFCMDIDASLPAPEDVAIAVYRIAQETLNNIDRHAGATCVTAHLYRRPGCVRLSIRDDGRGFDPAAVTSDHMGLDIMRERAEEASLALTLTSRPGEGACLRVEWMAEDHDH
ncbi:MAG: 7TM-DISM domain-containing protein [Anaerolineae bacterium]